MAAAAAAARGLAPSGPAELGPAWLNFPDLLPGAVRKNMSGSPGAVVRVLALPLRSCDLGKRCRTSVSPFGITGEEEYLSFAVEMLLSGDYMFELLLAPEKWSEGISDCIRLVEGVHVKSGVHSYQLTVATVS